MQFIQVRHCERSEAIFLFSVDCFGYASLAMTHIINFHTAFKALEQALWHFLTYSLKWLEVTIKMNSKN
jgi:hypothetical protein